jgi:endonuclease G, mitochondrial
MPSRRYTAANDLEPLIDSSINAFLRLTRRAQIIVVVVLLIAGIIAAVVYLRSQHFGPVATSNLLLGNPSGASQNPLERNNYLMLKPYYVLSYDSQTGTPNWVSWEVTVDDLGTAPRKQVFDADATLPPTFNVVVTHDYVGGGFDRGHMCPHSDRAADEQMSFSTFVMTNIIPQAPNVNRKAWAQMEDYCRELVREHNHLYLIAGPAGRGGTGSRGFRQTLAGGKVVVPSDCWKVAVVVPEDGATDDLAKISMGTRVIVVDMPNDDSSVGEAWAQYRTNAAVIEQKTGYHFFDKLRPDIAQALRQKVDDVPIPPPRPRNYGGTK